MNTFERDRISFRYPANWSVEIDDEAGHGNSDGAEDAGGWTVTVSSPETAFLMVSLRPDADHPADLADLTLEALKAEYAELDAENVLETIRGQPAVGYDVDFLTADTPVTCRVRCLDTFAGPLLLMAQVSEFDRQSNDPVLRATVASLDVETD